MINKNKIFLLSFLIVSFSFILVNFVYAYEIPTHRDLTKKIIETYNQSHTPKITPEQTQWIMDGSIKEDIPPRWINHFYDPINNVGWSGEKQGDIPAETIKRLSKIILSSQDAISSLNWLHNQDIQAKYSFYEGNQTYNRAIESYAYANLSDEIVIERPSFATFKNSYKALGHILHLLEDLGVPAHTRNDTHADIIGTGDKGEPYEQWVVENVDFSSLNNLNLQKENFSCFKIDECFINLAKYSNENFYSEDTIEDSKYKLPKYINEDINVERIIYYGKDINSDIEFPLSVYYLKDENPYLTVKNPLIHQAYWQLLSKQVVLAGIQVIKSFNQDARDESENVKYPQHLVMFKRITFPMFSPFGTVAKLWNSAKSSFAQTISSVGGFFSDLFSDKDGFKQVGQVSLQDTDSSDEIYNQSGEVQPPETEIDNQYEEVELQNTDDQSQYGEAGLSEEDDLISGKSDLEDDEPQDQQEIPELTPEFTQELSHEISHEECSFEMGDGQTPSYQEIIINEVAWMGTNNSANDEWIELKNISSSEVNLSGWQLIDMSEQIKITFDNEVKIPINKFYFLERTDDNSVLSVVADLIYTGALSNSNEGLRLFDGQCNLIDEVLAEPSWPAGDNSQKRTMERSGDLSWHTYNGTAQNSIFGTPKAENSQPTAATTSGSSGGGGTPTNNQQPTTNDQQQTLKILINEIQIYPIGNRFIEFYNPNNSAVDLTDWYLQRKIQTGSSFTSLVSKTYFENKTIPAYGYFLISRDSLSGSNIILDNLTLTESNVIQLKNFNGDVVDKVGWGQASDCEGSCAVEPSSDQSIQRKFQNNTFIDTDNNNSDFEIQSCPSPKAQSRSCQSVSANQSPSAFFVFSPQNFEVNEEIIFNAASSTDPDGDIILYDWDFGNNQNTTTTQDAIVYSYSSAGDYLIQLTIFDDSNASSSISSTLVVSSSTPVASPSQPEANHIVISEIYPDKTGENQDFIELYNPANSEIYITDYSLIIIKENTTSSKSLVDFSLEDSPLIKGKSFFLIGFDKYNNLEVSADAFRSSASLYSSKSATILLVKDNEEEDEIIDSVVYQIEEIYQGQSFERKAWEDNYCISAQGDGEFLGNSCDSDNNQNDFEIRSAPNPQNSQSLPEPREAPTAVKDFNLSYSSSTVGINFNWQSSQDYIGVTSTVIYEIKEYNSPGEIIYKESGVTRFGKGIDEVGRDYNFSIQAFDRDGLGSAEITSSTISVPSFLKEVYFYKAPDYRAEHFRNHPATRNSGLGLSDNPYLLEFSYDQYPFLPDKVLGGQVGDFPPRGNWKAMVFYLNQEPLKDEFMYGAQASSSQAISFKYKNCIGYYSPSSALILTDSGKGCRDWGRIYTKALQLFRLEDKRIFLEMATAPANISSEDYITIAYYGFRRIQGFDNFKLIAVDKTKYYFQDELPIHQPPSTPSNLQFYFNENSSELRISFATSTDTDTIDNLIAYEFNYATSSEAGFDENNWQLIGADPTIFEVIFNNTYIVGVRAIDEFGNISSITSKTWSFPDNFIIVQEQYNIDINKKFRSAKGVAQVFIPAHSGYAKSLKVISQKFYNGNSGSIQAFLYDVDDPNNISENNLLASSTLRGVSSNDKDGEMRTLIFRTNPFLEEGNTYLWKVNFSRVSSNLKGTCSDNGIGGLGWAWFEKWYPGNCNLGAKNYYFSLIGSASPE